MSKSLAASNQANCVAIVLFRDSFPPLLSCFSFFFLPAFLPVFIRVAFSLSLALALSLPSLFCFLNNRISNIDESGVQSSTVFIRYPSITARACALSGEISTRRMLRLSVGTDTKLSVYVQTHFLYLRAA